ncbi:hypothetical protein GCM10017083_41760 [Thalassobaculum fulvum]|uniref:Uncharacterized protein n=1 Tax=Thalassobaculum fulvum TaxID=1633335 RepID=A0A918XVQ5_9PROT|nr:hypothetical protein GCM10017083_41760 [Thalassobaculum fulvum]
MDGRAAKEGGVLLIERMMARVVEFIACDLFGLDSRDVERARDRQFGPGTPPPAPRERRQVIVRFGR